MGPGPDRYLAGGRRRRPRGQVPVNDAEPAALGDVQVDQGSAAGLPRVSVVELGQAELGRAFHHGGGDRVRLRRPGDPHRAAGAALAGRAALPVLAAPEVGQHGGVIPAGRAGRLPGVVVGRVASVPLHRVGGAAAAEYPAARDRDGPAGHRIARRVGVAPVQRGAGQLGPGRRVDHLRDSPPVRPGLDQQHGGVRRGRGQAGRDDAAGRAAADDDVVVVDRLRCAHWAPW